MQLVRQGGFEGLASVAKLLLANEVIDLFEQIGVDRQGDFGFRHGGMMKYPTTRATRSNQVENASPSVAL